MKKAWFYPLIALILATMACQTIMDPVTDVSELDPEELMSPTGTDVLEGGLEQDETEATAIAADSGEVVFSDDFDDPSTGWEIGDYESGSVGYTTDAYFVISEGGNDAMWGIANKEYGDVIIEVEATQVRAPANDNNAYGVMCRVQGNGDGYLLRISGDGFYSIAKWSNDELVPLVDWTTSDVIELGDSTNQLRATCDGSSLSLEVNGQMLATVQDSEFNSGDIAFTATSFEEGPTEVHFDNLEVLSP